MHTELYIEIVVYWIVLDEDCILNWDNISTKNHARW